ncbi:MAG: DUF167 domain-containing protein [Francisellaceae bacterium]|nr:DUF167 domain-containing protein [Francisellaceae bacterium]MBT6206404.1 DUF167 domain-containing protein [Francisellaceae bacterium]MBT6538246.1 DUF167 domain-containing protein [Francisellaceae bacterium]
MDLFNSLEDYGDTFTVTVSAKAASNRIKVSYNKEEERSIRIYVTAVPEDGKANKEVIKLLAKELGVTKTSLTIIKGHKSKEKIIRLERMKTRS